MKRIFLFFSILLCSIAGSAQSAWLFNRGDSISWQPSQDMTITFEKDPAGFFWQNIQTSTLDVVRMPIYTKDGITFSDTPFLQAERNHYEVTNDGEYRFEVRLKTNINDWNSINCQPQVNWLRLVDTNGSLFPVISYTFEANANKTGDDLNGTIVFSYPEANLSETVEVKAKKGNLDPDAVSRERAVLMDFYRATDGDNWTRNDNWGSDKPVGEWYGITTDDFGHISAINLSDNNLHGEISSEIGNLTYLVSLSLLFNHLSGELPNGLRNLNSLVTLDLGTNELSGSIPEWIGELKNLQYMFLYFNQFSGELPTTIGDMESLEVLLLDYNQLSGSIPQSIAQLKNARQLHLSNNLLSGEIPQEIGRMNTLSSLTLYNNHIVGNIPATFANLYQLEVLNVGMNDMDGIIPEEITMSEMWSNSSHIIEQREGHELKVGKIYESKDYSHDGEITSIQTHKKGKGITLIITGTAYSDRNIENGSFMKDIRLAYERFFDVEPYKSFKDYFDVYCITTISKNEYVGGTEIAYGADFFDLNTGNFSYTYNAESIVNYINKVEALNKQLDNVTLLLIVKDKNAMGTGICSYWADNFAIAISDSSDDNIGTIQHEAGGHAFAKLADEYFLKWNDTHNVFPEGYYATLDADHNNGYWLNVDYKNDPAKVLWKDFLSNPDYNIENLGIYEGGFADYEYGIYRPSVNSVMNDATLFCGYFNAPSRWAIYQRIMKLAGEECKFEDFLAYDKKNLGTQQRSSARAKAISAKRDNDIREAQQFGAKPIIYNYPSSEIGKHK